jgi:two-component sensor histidine kinase/PAS domain-containing protein
MIMIWQETPFTLPLLGLSLLSLALGCYVWTHYRSPLGKTGAYTILFSTEWIFMYVPELAGGDLPTKVFWAKMQYPGLVFLPTAWFVFAIYYTGREKWLSRHVLAGLSVIPVLTLILVFTNESHGLIWSAVTLDTAGSFLVLNTAFGLWMWVFMGHAFILLLTGVVLLGVQCVTCSNPRFKRQSGVLLGGALIPWVAIAMVAFGVDPFPRLNLILFALILTNIVVAFNIFYFKLGDVVPLAREAILESMTDSVIVLDPENYIVDANPSAKQLLGITHINLPVEQVWPAWSQIQLDTHGQEVVLNADAEQTIYDVSVSPLIDWRGRTVSRVVVLRDVTDRKRSERFKQSLQEKELLLQEIHHRVKNNMQIISSLLNLQSFYVKDPQYMQLLKECKNRIQSMALIHEKLYKSESLTSIDFNTYITDLVNTLFRTYNVNPEDISLHIKGDISLEIDTAIPCGLIINELVSNALKHAFPHGKGEITIIFQSIGENVQLVVKDTGVGLPEDVDVTSSESLGLRLVTILARDQMGGEITVNRNNGTTFCITFKPDIVKKR